VDALTSINNQRLSSQMQALVKTAQKSQYNKIKRPDARQTRARLMP